MLLMGFAMFARYIDKTTTLLTVGNYTVNFESFLLAATVVYFISASIWIYMRGEKKPKEGS